MEKYAARLRALFPTLPGVYYERSSELIENEHGKLVPKKQVAVRKPLTEEAIQDHFEGRSAIAVSPFMQDGKSVQFMALDFDIYGLSLAEVLAPIEKLKLSAFPWVPAQTKSGGWHLFLFFEAPVKADGVVKTLRKMKVDLANALGCEAHKIEYRPVQSKINVSQGDVGTGVTLPLYDSTPEEREQWLVQAESSLIKPELVNDALDEGIFKNAPPCLFTLFQRGQALNWENTGFRNNFIYQLSVFFKKKHPTDWQERVREFNEENTGKEESEVESIIQSIERQENGKAYQCTGIFADVCNKQLCGERKFGIGSKVAHELLDLDNITRVDGEQVAWFLTLHTPLGERRMKLTTDELYNPDTLRKRCMEHGVLPDLPKRKEWDEQLRLIVTKASVVEQAASMSPLQKTEDMIWKFFECSPTTKDPKEILMGKIFLEDTPDGEVFAYFKHTDFESFVERGRGRAGLTLYQSMQEFILTGFAALAQVRLEDINIDVWRIPVPDFRLSLQMEGHIR